MRCSVDTGGTFTDLVLEDDEAQLHLYKSATTPNDPVVGVLDVLHLAAEDLDTTLAGLLGAVDLFIHATTRAINAILTGSTAPTALLVTEGHRDVLVFREGGRTDPFNFTRPYPPPYVPRALTFAVRERIGAGGEVVVALDEERLIKTLREVAATDAEAVAVCLLWSIVNPQHETRVGALIEEQLPGIPYTLSNELNPALREYRRASSSAIDASLKPVMTTYLGNLQTRLNETGFRGRLLMVTSSGGVLDAGAVADAPIHVINSGPSMAPVAGRHYARIDGGTETAIVADTGGTSYDVSLVRRGEIPRTRDTWLGERYLGHFTGFPSVDVKSIGAGGGSIAWVDGGGLLHVGPQSAGSVPGPVCYGRGGDRPTVTDSSLVLGHLDPDRFLGGALTLHADAARVALADQIAQPLGLDLLEAAAAVVEVATEHMVGAIEEITIDQGIDPSGALLVGGGGAAGLNAVAIARRLGCERVVIPEVGATLSAAGALISELRSSFERHFLTASGSFDRDRVNEILSELEAEGRRFVSEAGSEALETAIDLSVEARYPHQVWELEVPLRMSKFSGPADLERVCEDFHAVHREVFAVADPESPVEFVGWRASARCKLRDAEIGAIQGSEPGLGRSRREAHFPGLGLIEVDAQWLHAMETDVPLSGPAIIESSFTTIVVDPEAVATRSPSGSVVIDVGAAAGAASGRAADRVAERP